MKLFDKPLRKFLFFGPKGKYETFNWFENHLSGHIHIGLPFGSHITFFGCNAMRWAVNWRIMGAYICFRPLTRSYGRWWLPYFYISPDGTPNKATFKMGWTGY